MRPAGFGPGRALALARTAAADWRKGLVVAGKVVPLLPRRGDGLVGTGLKLAAIAGEVGRAFGVTMDGAHLHGHMTGLGLRRLGNEAIVRLIFRTPVRAACRESRYSLGDDFVVIRLEHPALRGPAFFAETRGGFLGPRLLGECWLPQGVDLADAAGAIWASLGDRIGVSFERDADEPYGQPQPAYAAVAPPDDPLLGSGPARLEAFVARQRRFAADGVPRSYLLLGPPGTGKSTFALRAADALGGRALRVDGSGLTGRGTGELAAVFDALGPRALVVDDLDRAADLEEAMPRLLTAVTDLQARRPEMAVFVTANSLRKLAPPGPDGEPDDALVSRLNEVVDFGRPGPAERADVLAGYASGFGAPFAGGALADALVEATEGMTERYLREVALQLRYDEPGRVLEVVRRRCEALRPYEPGDGPKNGASKAVAAAPRG